VKAVVAVDNAGQSCDMPAIAAVARERGAVVIEDACHALGSGFVHDGRVWRTGGHPWADMTVFSFHPVKTMTTGEGGMLVTDNPEWAAKARQFRSHGIVREPSKFVGLDPASDSQPSTLHPQLSERGPWYHEMQELGYNYRITDIQCALGLSQLKRLDQFVSRRREIVGRYNDAFGKVSWLHIPGLKKRENGDFVSWHLYTVQIDFDTIGKKRSEVMKELRLKGVGTQVLYIPVHLQPWYRQTFGYAPGKCPVAEAHYQRTLSLPLYPTLTDADIEHVQNATVQLGI
jgi:perosamine synthetase